MGVDQIDTILMILCVSTMMNEKEKAIITSLLMQGFNDCAEEAKTTVTGG